MTFLAPATGLAALAAGVALTLLWYFLKLRRRPVRVSSTLLWARAARDLEVNAPLRWIRPSWLLFLQLLAVALLAGAVGRPAVSGGERAAERWVLVIDRSASMSATDGESGTRLEEALARAETVVRRMGSGERAMVASFAGSARLEAAMTADRGVLLASLEGITATDQPADFGAALELVAAQLGEDPGGVLVVVLSGGGFVTPEGGAALGEAEVRFMRVGAAEPAENTGIVAMSARRDASDPATLRCFVRVAHAGASARDATVSLFFDGERVDGETLAVEPGGQASAVFETRATVGGVLRAEIAGRDALASDDEAWVVVPAAVGAAAVLVHPDEVGADPFLERALGVATGREPVALSVSEWDESGGPAASFVVFDRCEPGRASEGSSLHVGAGAPGSGVRLVRYEAGSARRVLAWERAHPALRFLSLDGVVISGAPALEWDEGVRAQTIMLGEDGALAAAIDEGAVRRLVLAFGPDGSNWETDPSFPLFMQLASEWLAPRATGEGVSRTTGMGAAVRAVAPEVIARGPVEATALARDDGLARFGAFERVGLYTLEGAEEALLAVNLFDERETSLATRDALTLGGRSVGGSGVDAVTVRELWRWFVLGGLLLACIEWLIYAKKMRV